MPQDAYTLKHLSAELNDMLKGAKVNKINQPVADEIVLHLYNKGKNFKLLISANAIGARITLSDAEKPNPLTAYGYCMLLRKYLISAEIKSVELVGYERIVRITFNALNDFFESRERSLYAEIMGKYSNVVLTENDKILGSLKAFNLDINSLRPLMAGMKYSLPPKQDKFYPDELELVNDLVKVVNFEDFDKNSFDFGGYLFSLVIGFSKATANECAYRFIKKHGLLSRENVQFFEKFIKEFVSDVALSPCVKVLPSGKLGDFYLFNYESAPGKELKCESIVTAQETFYDKKEFERTFGDGKRKLLSVVKKVEDKLKKRQSIIDKKELDAKDYESDRIKGELIISNLYKIKEGQTETEVENYYDDNKIIKILLDKTLSPSKNAESYFKRYNKQKRTLDALIPQREELKKEFGYITALKAEIEIADSLVDLKEIEEELKEVGFIKSVKGKQKKAKKTKFTTYLFDGYQIKIGKNNIQNDELTFSATGQSLWLHAKDYHSSHVIIEHDGRDFTDEVIRIASEICAYYSEARQGGKVAVDYVKRNKVKKPPKSNLGFVTYTGQKTIVVSPNKHENLIKKQ